MRRFRPVREQAAANVGEPHRIQLAVRKAFPSETPAFASLGQVPAKTDVDKALEPSEGLAGVRVPEVVDRRVGRRRVASMGTFPTAPSELTVTLSMSISSPVDSIY